MTANTLVLPMPGESLYSLIGRLGLVNGMTGVQTCNFFLGDNSGIRVADALFNTRVFQHRTQDYYQAETLHSLSNLRFKQQVSQNYFNINNKLPGKADYKSLISLSKSIDHIWKWCPECYFSDIAIHGFTYWRVSCQHPAFIVCPIHSCALYKAQLPFRERQQHFFYPDVKFVNHHKISQPSLNSRSTILAQRLTHISIQIMKPDFILNRGALKSVLSKQLNIRQLSFSNLSKLTILFQSFSGYLGSLQAFTSVSPVLQLNQFKMHFLALMKGEERSFTNSAFLGLLICWLFEEWSHFFCLYTWEVEMFRGFEALKVVEKGSRNPEHRAICRSYLDDNPSAVKSDFWKKYPKSCKWLNTNDAQWFNSQLPHSKLYNHGQKELFVKVRSGKS